MSDGGTVLIVGLIGLLLLTNPVLIGDSLGFIDQIFDAISEFNPLPSPSPSPSPSSTPYPTPSPSPTPTQTPTPTPTPTPVPGDTVASSELINFYTMTSTEAQTWVNIIDQQGFTEVTLRLNAMNEWSSGQPSTSGVSKTKEIINLCQAREISVNLDLHTWYTTWDSNFDSSASNAATKRTTYLSYIINTINAFSGTPVKAWMVLNEPQAQTATSDENQFLLNCISTAKQRTSSPVSIRFMAGYSPSTGHYASSIDDASGYLCRNTYWDPRKPSTEKYGTTEAKMNAAITAANSRGKELWITEFGRTNADQNDQKAFTRAFVDYAKSRGIDRVFAWVMQPESPSGESYNIFGANYAPLPAFYELK